MKATKKIKATGSTMPKMPKMPGAKMGGGSGSKPKKGY